MNINITDQIISEFLIGVITVLATVAVGVLLLFILNGIKKTFPFTRIVLVVALAPLSLIYLLDPIVRTVFLFYALIAILIGIITDGINHLLHREDLQATLNQAIEKTDEPDPGAIVWEKAE